VEKTERKRTGLCCAAIAGVVVLAVLAIAVVVKYYVLPRIPSFGPPRGLEGEGPSVGADRFEATVVFEDGRIGPVSDIAIGDYDPASGDEIVVAGLNGAAFLDQHLRTTSFVEFERPEDRPYGRTVEVVDVDGDGVCEFLARGSYLGLDQGALLDHEGRLLWRTGADTGTCASMAAGDVDSDGLLEFATFQDGAIEPLDATGTKIWETQPEGMQTHTIQMADVTSDGVPEVVYGRHDFEDDRKVELVGLDAQGEIVYAARRKGDYLIAGLFFAFSVCPWPTADSPPHFLAPLISSIMLFDAEGRTVLKGRAPGTMITDFAVGTPVRFQAGSNPWLASLVVSFKYESSSLRVHDPEGQLLYEETRLLYGRPDVLWVGMAPWQPPGEDAEVLLVGGADKVWQYRLKP